MPVFLVDIRFAVECDLYLFAGKFYPQRMPDILRHRCVDVLERFAAAVLGVVERDVVLQRVGARNVVIVAILPAPDDAAGLILAAADRRPFPDAAAVEAASRVAVGGAA